MRTVRISVVNTRGLQKETNDVILTRAKERIQTISRDRPDIILLSELFANYPKGETRKAVVETAQNVPGPITEELAVLARRYRTYIAFGLLRRNQGRFFNSMVILDRRGQLAWIYDKVTPVTTEMRKGGITPGKKPDVFQCDFGRIGAVVCFDINFFELAEIYFRQETELILFSSAFPAGRLLDIWAIRWGFNMAASTWYDYNRVIDCTGRTVAQTSDILPYTTCILNLNRRVVHMDFNLDRIQKMLKKYKGDVLVEDMRPEAMCVITSLKKGLEVSDLIREFKIETLPAYFDRSRKTRHSHGGMPAPKWW